MKVIDLSPFDFKEVERWDEMWKKTRKPPSEAMIQTWNVRAQSFAGNVLGQSGRQRTGKVMNWFDQLGVNLDGAAVLDIGAGPGAFAIPFAQRKAKVTALEPSSAMCELMLQHASKQDVEIDVISAVWEDFDIEQNHWVQAYDLVFASMCPAISCWDYVEKALRCSRKYAFFSTFAGKREHNLISELWPVLVGGQQPPMRLDIQYLLNLLYLHQYTFEFRVFEESRDDQMTPERAIDYVMQLLPAFQVPVQVDTREKITHFLADRYPNAVPIHTATRFGQILVSL